MPAQTPAMARPTSAPRSGLPADEPHPEGHGSGDGEGDERPDQPAGGVGDDEGDGGCGGDEDPGTPPERARLPRIAAESVVASSPPAGSSARRSVERSSGTGTVGSSDTVGVRSFGTGSSAGRWLCADDVRGSAGRQPRPADQWLSGPPLGPERGIDGPWLRGAAGGRHVGVEIDRTGLAAFLRRRRESLQPEDVGLPRGQRRRTSGLRREEVAALCHMSTDYYARLERERGPQPSEQMIASIAQGLHLSLAERDHLFRLAGQHPPARGVVSEHISPGLLRILDRLADTPAEIVTELGETLRQTPLGVALTGDTTRHTGPARSIGYRWFTDPAARALFPPGDHALLSRRYVSGLRSVVALRGPDSRAAHLAELLLPQSEISTRACVRS